MTKKILMIISLFVLVHNNAFSIATLIPAKQNHILTDQFLNMLREVFNIDVFIETGTYLGESALKASRYFTEIHTIELSKNLYNHSSQRLSAIPNIKCYQGDSSKVLHAIVKELHNRPAIFWFDAHYSEGNTAKAAQNTPILEELMVLKNFHVKEAVILIDDIRCFFESNYDNNHRPSLDGYPTIAKLHETILEINPNYEFIIYGDIALAFPKNLNIPIPDILRAFTVSYQFDDNPHQDENEVLKAEYRIMHATQAEENLINSFAFFNTAHYKLWEGLILLQKNKKNLARQKFLQARKLGITHTRINLYLNLCN